MTTLIFATNNPNKVAEINALTGSAYDIVSLSQAGIDIDIPEPHDTLHENASEKSRTIHQMTGKNCFSEDTGLEVEVLNGEPGVKSARYAGEDKAMDANIDKLLGKLQDHDNRRAQFRTVISLILDGEEHFFEGICHGHILHERSGSGGFGYDSVFMPDGAAVSFGQMTMEQKNQFSHRKKAVAALLQFLSQNGTNVTKEGK